MSLSMYQIASQCFEQSIPALLSNVRKGEAFALSQNINPATMLTAKICPNMYDFAQQVRAAARQAIWTYEILEGKELTEINQNVANFAEIYALVESVLDRVRHYDRAEIDKMQHREVSIDLARGTLKMSGEDYLLKFAIPNFYFHTAVAYAILRQSGVALHKGDFLGPLT